MINYDTDCANCFLPNIKHVFGYCWACKLWMCYNCVRTSDLSCMGCKSDRRLTPGKGYTRLPEGIVFYAGNSL